MASGLRIPLGDTLVWAPVMRPRVPIVYLDLNSVIFIARAMRGDSGSPVGYRTLYESALRAKSERRAIFPLGEAHLWEILKISDPAQRERLVEVVEPLSDYNYLLGRGLLAELEFRAGIARLLHEEIETVRLPLLRPTVGQVFGIGGNLRIREATGEDATSSLRAEMGGAEFDTLIANLNFEFQRRVLSGPSDQDLMELRNDADFRPEVALEIHRSRLSWELETRGVLDAHPEWRRGRLRDLIGAREMVHEWLDMLNRISGARVVSGLSPFNPTEEDMRRLLASLPQFQVAVSIKTALHRNPNHGWTENDITDIDALSVAFPYCDAVFPDKAMRSVLVRSRELTVFGTFVPRRAEELTEWLDALPSVDVPDLLVPHPYTRDK